MVDQSQFSIGPDKTPTSSDRKSDIQRKEPPKEDKNRFREVLRDRDRDEREALIEESEGEVEKESIFSMSSKRKDKPGASKRALVEDADSGLAEGKVDLSQETRPDLAQVNPVAGLKTEVQNVGGKGEAIAAQRSDLQELVDQLVDKLTIMKTSNDAETSLTLKHPPLFKGAIIKVTEFDHARGEFNLSIENLSLPAKQLTDLEASRLALKQTLEEKGYMLHIVRTNTEVEAPMEAREAFARGDQEQQGQDQEQNQPDEEQDQS